MKKAIYRRVLTARRGSSAVEFAVIAPVMILFTFGLIEISRLMLVKQTITHATREGARVAVRPMGSLGEVTQIIQDELLVQGIEESVIVTDPTNLESAEPGSEVTVRVSVGINSISWLPGYFSFAPSEIVAETCMRREH